MGQLADNDPDAYFAAEYCGWGQLGQLGGRQGWGRTGGVGERGKTGISSAFIILLMQVEARADPFQIIHHARSSRATRSRKSSVSIVEKDRGKKKLKKMRKMTMNPESVQHESIREIEQWQEKGRSVQGEGEESVQGEMEEEEGPGLEARQSRLQSSGELQLENGICHGIRSERQLDQEFKCGWRQTGMDWVMLEQ